jgi:hypothetical protein
MRGVILSFIFFTVFFTTVAQVSFRTVAPQQPVVVGESFEVQYIVEGDVNVESFTAPSFIGFRYVTGPHVYKGAVVDLHISMPLINTVYTLAAVKPGRFLVQGAKISVNGNEINSNDAFIEVISKEEAYKRNKRKDGSFYNGSEYFLRPGEDPIEKIRRNLFMKVMVDRHTCYVGEPVVATYKLYSRLESKSDIVKNPGFYGFSVHDMINLADRSQATETINGKTFDVHTVRKVQLYPLQAGTFTIDAMEISNKVEFSRSGVNKKTEQEIIEGVLGKTDDAIHSNTEVYESTLKTDAVPVVVRPLPAKNKTDSFTAAVGDFSIHASLEKNSIAKNEQCRLLVCITGKGNFTQINSPVVKWPAGIDAFEPVVKDSIDRLTVPLTGSKTFSYTFVPGKGGTYELPAVTFNFFNPDTNRFVKLETGPLIFQVGFKEKEKEKIAGEATSHPVPSIVFIWLSIGLFVMVLASVALFWSNKNSRRKTQQIPVARAGIETDLSIEDILESSRIFLVADNNNFYRELHRAIWEYFRQKIKVSRSAMNKLSLVQFLQQQEIADNIVISLIEIMDRCETVMYTDSIPVDSKKDLFAQTKIVLRSIDSGLK